MRNRKILNVFLLLICIVFGEVLYGQSVLSISMSTTPACSLDGSVTATVTGGTPPYIYSWYSANNSLPQTTNALIGLGGGSYYLTVQDQNQNYAYTQAIVASAFNFSAVGTPELCGNGTGTATATVLSGVGPFTYLWNTGATTPVITGLSQGEYDITITDAAGCFASSVHDSLYGNTFASVRDSSPITFGVATTPSTCTDGTASVINLTNGTAPYTYVWGTTPAQFTPTATSVAGNSYGTVVVTDAMGCTYAQYFYVGQAPNGLSASTSSNAETCLQSNGSASVNIAGGAAPYTYHWSNGGTTPTITGLSYGYYNVTVTDNNNCPKYTGTSVNRTDPMTLSFNHTPPSCLNQNGSLSVVVTGGAPPYSYIWGNGNTTSGIGNLSAGYYGVSITDANGCFDHDYTYLVLPPNCYGNVSGSSIGDVNNNCVHDGSDYPFANRLIDLGAGGYGITDANGDYSEDLLPGTYTIAQPTPPNYYAQTCPSGPSTYTVTNLVAGQNVGNLDFFNATSSTVNDLSISVYASPARPTSLQYVTIYYHNNGATMQNAVINYVHDPLMSLYTGGWNLSNYNSGTRTLTYNLGPVYPGASGSVYCYFSIPTTTTLGTSYTQSAEILPIINDATPSDNQYSLTDQVVAAYDPNDKSVVPAGTISANDSVLTYTVRFQNTGNDTAFTVAIRDTIDTDLDIFSLEVLGASHPYALTAEAPGVVIFKFENIMLPDSFVDEPASHGHIIYRIKLKDNLSPGTEIRNRAAIYFDYNVPVLTNTTVNALGIVAVEPKVETNASFGLYPNPATDRVTVALGDSWIGETQVTVRDLSGRLLHSEVVNPAAKSEVAMDLQQLPSGVYLVECMNARQRMVRKLVLQ